MAAEEPGPRIIIDLKKFISGTSIDWTLATAIWSAMNADERKDARRQWRVMSIG